MTDKYQNKYRVQSTRLVHWDYGWNAAYFVTIRTQDGVCYFGDIVVENAIDCEPQMQLSKIGQVADDCWIQIPHHFPFVKLGNHIVMPNHLHGIVIIDKPKDGRDGNAGIGRDAINRVSTIPATTDAKSQTTPGGVTGINNPMLHDNLSKIIRWYKGRTTFESRKIFLRFAWQSRFHDHIIRDEKSFHAISQYIINNPLKWRKNRFSSR
jgi:putative transposase